MTTPCRVSYPSDLSDEQWELLEPLIPKPKSHPNFPSPIYERREIVNAILYLMRTGCQWRHLPHDFPKWQLVARYFYMWKETSVIDEVSERLQKLARLAQGRKASPTLGIIDSQSAKTTEVAAVRGFDAGKKSQRQKASHPGRRVRARSGGVGDVSERARP